MRQCAISTDLVRFPETTVVEGKAELRVTRVGSRDFNNSTVTCVASERAKSLLHEKHFK